PAHDGGVGAYGRPAPDPGGLVLVLARNVGTRIDHVGEHARRAAEDVGFELDPFVDGHVVLDLDVVADAGARHHHDILAQVAALADHRAGHHVRKVPDPGAGADHRTVIDIAGFVGEPVGHRSPQCEGVLQR